MASIWDKLGETVERVGIAAEGVGDPTYWQKRKLHRENKDKEQFNALVQMAARTAPGSQERLEFVRAIINSPVWPEDLRRRMQKLYTAAPGAQPEASAAQAQPGQQTAEAGVLNWPMTDRPNYKIFYDPKTGQARYFDISQGLPDPNQWTPESPQRQQSFESLQDLRTAQTGQAKAAILQNIQDQLGLGEPDSSQLGILRQQAQSIGYDIVKLPNPAKPGKFVYRLVPRKSAAGWQVPTGTEETAELPVGGAIPEESKAAAERLRARIAAPGVSTPSGPEMQAAPAGIGAAAPSAKAAPLLDYWDQIPAEVKPLVTQALEAGDTAEEIIEELKSRGIIK